MHDTDLDPAALLAWETFVFAHAAAVARIERDMHAAGTISLAWYDVLVALHHAPGERLRMGDLAERVVLSRSGLTRLVDRIERAGLLVREPVPGDRRGTQVVLTDAGRESLAAAWPRYAHGIARYFAGHLTSTEHRQVAAALSKVRWQDH